MWRSSQPKCGVSGTCAADERLLDLIAQSCVFKRTPTGTVKATGDPLLCIIDCRPKVIFFVINIDILINLTLTLVLIFIVTFLYYCCEVRTDHIDAYYKTIKKCKMHAKSLKHLNALLR